MVLTVLVVLDALVPDATRARLVSMIESTAPGGMPHDSLAALSAKKKGEARPWCGTRPAQPSLHMADYA